MKTRTLFTLVFFILSAIAANAQPTENSIKFELSQTAIVAGQDGLIMRTIDGGDNWTTLNSGITTGLNSIDWYTHPVNESYENIHIAVGEGGVILKSRDNGETWAVKTSGTNENLNDIMIVSAMFTVACGDNGTVIYSFDLGETWQLWACGSTENLNDLFFAEGTDYTISRELYYTYLCGMVAGDNGTILTVNGLTGTWLNVPTNITDNFNTVCYISGETFFAAGSGGVLIKTTDKGVNFERINCGTTEDIHDLRFIDFNTAVASCNNGVILSSVDAGATWQQPTTPTTNNLFALHYTENGFVISVGANGTEIYSTDAGLSWVTKESFAALKTEKKNDISLMQNYPNPFNPSTVINYELPFNANVTLKVYNMLGQEVATLISAYQNSGPYSVSFNASSLSSGIYFYTLNASNNNEEIIKTMKMILTK